MADKETTQEKEELNKEDSEEMNSGPFAKY